MRLKEIVPVVETFSALVREWTARRLSNLGTGHELHEGAPINHGWTRMNTDGGMEEERAATTFCEPSRFGTPTRGDRRKPEVEARRDLRIIVRKICTLERCQNRDLRAVDGHVSKHGFCSIDRLNQIGNGFMGSREDAKMGAVEMGKTRRFYPWIS